MVARPTRIGSPKAVEAFRNERMGEPLEDYLRAFDEYVGRIEELLATTSDLSELESSSLEVLTDPNLLEAFRYLAGPPVSEDDLKVLADAPSLAKGRLKADPEGVGRLVRVVRQVLDRRRFSWVIEGREPTEAERAAAVMASAALMATSRVQTRRRNVSKDRQEAQVMQTLAAQGLKEASRRRITTPAEFPAVGEYCGESVLWNRKVDIVCRLWDGRLMPIECKVSNSSLNSIKRLNNDAAVKAEVWRAEFGRTQVVPAAVLGGVFALRALQEAQARGLALFWAHDLKQLSDWIEQTRLSAGRRPERE